MKTPNPDARLPYLPVIIILLIATFSSCMITNTPGFYSGYKKLSPEQKSIVNFVLPNDLPKANYLNAITAKHLYDFTKDSSPVIIYFWSPHCSSSACIPISSFKNYCIQNSYTGIIVCEYYDFEMLQAQGVKSSEVFAINQKYYKADYCNKYLKLFQNEFMRLYNYNNKYKYPLAYLYTEKNKLNSIGLENMPTPPWKATK